MKSLIRVLGRLLVGLVKLAASLACLALAAALLFLFGTGNRKVAVIEQAGDINYGIQDRFDQFVTNTVSDALDGVLAIDKVYWLSDSDLVAPKPNPDCYGSSADPAVIQQVIDGAAALLDGQELLYNAQTPLYADTEVNYYYDPTILALTWKQMIDNTIYCISEIKIADASQFRRFMSDGQYMSGAKYLTSEMAASVNAVVATNGDYYTKRFYGMVINNGQLLRAEGTRVDACAVDAKGDLHFVEVNEIVDPAEMQKFIDDNDIRFSLAFGPILIEDGKIPQLKLDYPEGETRAPNARLALCQMDSLHYLLVIASIEPPYEKGVVLKKFAEDLATLGCDKAYNMDGGRSATMIMNNQLQNFIYERLISDIIYFATAIPNGG